jgi:trimeric autotransporter adhesin
MPLYILTGSAQIVITNPASPWTVPAGVTSIKVEVWGGGGGGGGCNSTLGASYGSGGGGGAYNVSTLAVSAGQNYIILRGTGGTGSSDANGTKGTESSVSGPGGSVSANPGLGGARRGGNAGTGGTGGFNNGGTGGKATSNGAGGGGGAGNAAPTGSGRGGDGSNTAAGSAGAGALPGGTGGTYRNSTGTGNAGSVPGGGGGGSYQSGWWAGSQSGGNGASGKVVITYTSSSATTITGFSPGSACSGSGQLVSITGTNFTGATTVTFYNGQSASFTVTSATQITALLPVGATTGAISVTTPSGTGTSSASFIVNASPAAPTVGTITHPTCVTSTGSVVLNGLPATGTWILTRTPGGTTTTGTGINTTISGLAAGTYNYTVTNSSGCTSVLSANIVINAQPVRPIVPAQITSISSGETFTVTPSGGTIPAGTTYTWTTPVYTGSVTGGTAQAVPQINIRGTLTIPSGTGTATYTVTPASGSCVGATFTVTVTVTSACPFATLTSSDADNVFCSGTSITFTAGGGTNYNFMVGGVSVQNGPSATYTTASLNNGQVVTVTASSANGCISTSAPILNIVNPLPILIVSSPVTCSIDLATYSLAVASSSGFVTSTSGTVTNSGGNIWTISLVPVINNITVKVTDNAGCENSIVVTAPNCSCPEVLDPVSGGNRSYCESGIIPTINATVLTGETIDWYNSASGGTLLGSGLSFTPTGPGTYYAMARNTTTNCVSNTRTPITVTRNPLPVPTLTSSDADNIFCAGTSIIFTAGGGTAYNFRIGGMSVQSTMLTTYTTNSLTNGQVVDVVVTSASGCIATSAAITNTVNSLPVPTLTSSDADNIFCAGSSVIFTASGGTNYNFRVGGASVQNGPSANYTTNLLTNGQRVDVVVTNAKGCIATSAAITNTVNAIPTANAGTGGNNCGLAFHLSGSLNIGTGTWTKVSGPGNAIFSPDVNTAGATVTVSTYGSYVFSWTVVNGTCSNSANITIVFIQQPSANAGAGGDECDKNFILKALPTTGTGTWTKVTGPGNAVFTPDIHQPDALVTVDKFGVYEFEWTVVNSTCSSVDTLKVAFHDLPLVNAGKDTTICKGGNIQLQAQGSGSVSWIPGALLSNPDIFNPVATPYITTTFTANLTDQFGCKNSDNIVVWVREKIIANAGPDQVLEYLLTTTMDAELAYSYEKGVWSVISGTGNFLESTNAKTAVRNLSFGINKFLWTVTNDFCKPADDTVIISVNELVIPTLITPNMDGRNDYLVLRGLSTLGKTELIIFDRSGVLVYKNTNYDNSWDGVDYNNNPLPDDTYFYILRSANGKSISGFIVIKR